MSAPSLAMSVQRYHGLIAPNQDLATSAVVATMGVWTHCLSTRIVHAAQMSGCPCTEAGGWDSAQLRKTCLFRYPCRFQMSFVQHKEDFLASFLSLERASMQSGPSAQKQTDNIH